jgi:4-amino-4-deoxy-L-arabinose transferase-like glycosyltransferase
MRLRAFVLGGTSCALAVLGGIAQVQSRGWPGRTWGLAALAGAAYLTWRIRHPANPVNALKTMTMRQSIATLVAVAVGGVAIRLIASNAGPAVQIAAGLLYVVLAALFIYVFFAIVMGESRRSTRRHR